MSGLDLWKIANFQVAGCGKTILASSVIDTLITAPRSEGQAVAYHYCDHADKRTLDATAIFGSLARSLLETVDLDPHVSKLIDEYYRNGERIPEPAEVLDILSKTIYGFGNITIVLDGIDEAREDDRQVVYEGLKKLSRTTKTWIKIAIFCREDAARAVCNSPGTSFSIRMCDDNISTDINDYIRHSVTTLLESGELAVRSPELEETIVKTLANGAKGM